MKKKLLIYTIMMSLLFGGCVAQKLEPKIHFDEPKKIEKETYIQNKKPATTNNGSLFRMDNDLYSSNSKSLDIGDIIQVDISESLKSDSIGERKADKTNDTDLGGGVVTPVTGTFNGVQRLANKVNSSVGLGITTNSANSFAGKTSAKHDEKFTAIISAIIQDKLPNGNYVVYGTKEILIDGQLQIIKLSGIVRPYDIKLPDNTVQSSKLANAKIMYKKQGVEHDSMVKPWGTSIIENVWPF